MATDTLHLTGTETSSGVGPALSLGTNSLIGMFINISAVSGTLPTLTLTLQQTPNGTDWYGVQSFTTSALSTTGLTALYPSMTGQKVGDTVRCAWTITGVSPSFTFDVELVTEP